MFLTLVFFSSVDVRMVDYPLAHFVFFVHRLHVALRFVVLRCVCVCLCVEKKTHGTKQNPEHFRSLISFGEVLDPASKAAILALDSHVQMQGMINSEFHVSRAAKIKRERRQRKQRGAWSGAMVPMKY